MSHDCTDHPKVNEKKNSDRRKYVYPISFFLIFVSTRFFFLHIFLLDQMHRVGKIEFYFKINLLKRKKVKYEINIEYKTYLVIRYRVFILFL